MVPLVSLCLGATSRDVTRGVPSRRVDSNLGRHIRVKSASPMLEGLEADLSCRNWVEAAVSQQQVRWEMCVHDKRHDRHVTGQITARGCWECEFVRRTLGILRANGNTSRLVDIGANIGVYTLAAAAAGFQVDTFEPLPRHGAMLTASLERNALGGRVRLHTIGVGSRTQLAGVTTGQAHNQGSVTLTGAAAPGASPPQAPPFPRSLPVLLPAPPPPPATGARAGVGAAGVQLALPVMPLDDMLPPSSAPVFVKIDVRRLAVELHMCSAAI